jgi:hypothetical protein
MASTAPPLSSAEASSNLYYGHLLTTDMMWLVEVIFPVGDSTDSLGAARKYVYAAMRAHNPMTVARVVCNRLQLKVAMVLINTDTLDGRG